MHTKVIGELNKIKNKKIYFEALGGNNGDNLIEMGAQEVFKSLGLMLVSNIDDSDVIVINGSGDLSYHNELEDPIDNSRQVKIMLRNASKPVILLPSSCKEENVRKLDTLLKRRTASTIIFARDEISFNSLKTGLSDNIELYLDHDMALGLMNSELIQNLRRVKEKKQLLIVERFDGESASGDVPLVYKAKKLRQLMPGSIKRILKKILLKKVYSDTPFVEQAKDKVSELFPEMRFDQVVASDVSLPQNHSFDNFTKTVAESEVIVSTRLHVCILGFMLNKKVIAVQYEGGSKLLGVYNLTLQDSDRNNLWIRKK